MNVRNRLRSTLLNAYVSEGTRRRARAWHEARRSLTGGAHVVTAFLQIDDPYSYLLSRYLPALLEQYDVELQVRVCEGLGNDYVPAPEMLADHAVLDCRRMAAELGIPYLDKGAAPTGQRRALVDALASKAGDANFAGAVFLAMEAYWRGDATAVANMTSGAAPGDGAALVAKSRRKLDAMGHYNSAMLHYGGEWYWGVDRLNYLADRLDALGAARRDGDNARLASIRHVMHVDLPVRPPTAARELPSIDLFYSFRSPYSQLCLQRIFALADAYGLELVLRPVLPMMMRAMPLPGRKARYIVRDAMREAETHGVPFGNCLDPLGKGVERCHAVFAYALAENRARDFVLNASRLIWSQSVDACSDAGMRKITAKTGLFWPDVKQALAADDWRHAEAENRQLMLSLGSWGVPTMAVGDFVVWGQDRIWLLARHLEELCDSGEGILV